MRPLITFFTLAYLISWLIWLPLYSTRIGLPALPVLPYHHALGGLGPMIAAILTTRFYGKAGELGQLFRRCLKLRPVLYTLIALLAPFILVLIAFGIGFLKDGVTPLWGEMLQSGEHPEFGFAGFLLFNLLFFGFGEETGWRGFAFPRLADRFGPLTATFLLTPLWAAWHIPLFLYRPTYMSMDTAGIIGWIFSLLTGSVLLSWLYQRSHGSIWVCALFHATMDVAFMAKFSNAQMIGYTGFLVTIWGIVMLFFLRKPRKTVSFYRQESDSGM